MSELTRLAETAAAEARKAGADEAEAYLTWGRKLSIDIFNGEPEVFERAETGGAGLRAFRDKRMGYAYTTDLSEAGLAKAARLAYANAASSDADEFNGLPAYEKPVDKEELGLTSPDFAIATTAEKIDFALAMEETAKNYDHRITGCESVSYAEEDATVALANSAGFVAEYRRQTAYGYIDALAQENNDVQTGFSYDAGHSLRELDAAAAGREAAERAIVMLGGKSMKPATVTAVFDPIVFIQVLTAISPALNAEAAQKGRSFLAALVGKNVAPPIFNIIDDGRLTGGLGSAPFDDEGVRTQTTAVIEEGKLKTLLYNSYAARKAGVKATGSGGRGSFRMPPATGPTNLFIEPGNLGKDKIIEATENGLLVMGLQGLHAGVNAVTGQFSAGAFGLRILKGRLSGPVREITIASSCAEILRNVSAVGSDLRFVPMGASYGSPTVAVKGVVVSGR
ncbi:MAG: TldD/PmbA family protein [Actinomycetota bacterium]